MFKGENVYTTVQPHVTVKDKWEELSLGEVCHHHRNLNYSFHHHLNCVRPCPEQEPVL